MTIYIDPIHGEVDITDDLVQSLISTREVQRLRRIKQLSNSMFIFYGAEHSRFSHSLGVYILTKKVTEKLVKKNLINEDVAREVQIAGLLHDVGHGAFSHTFEKLFNTNHEDFTNEIILNSSSQVNKVLKTVSEDYPNRIASIIDHTHPLQFLSDIISSQLDCDRSDYLLRDSYYTGVKHSNFNLNNIINNMTISEGRLCFHEKAINSIEAFIISRHKMYQEVYFHKSNRSADILIKNLFKRAKYLYKKQKDFFYLTSPRLIPFFEDNYDLDDYLKLDDNIMFSIFSLWETSSDTILADLSRRILNRDFFTAIQFTDELELKDIKNDLLRKNVDLEYYTEINNSFDLPYKSKDEILIVKDGKIIELSELSKLAQSLKNIKFGNKLFYYPL